ncbi:MAG: hypothetical protein M1815_005735 [Lichina confinis]|nr:MAG: hypothetical protein M1815_005735 [Lichina confinis]
MTSRCHDRGYKSATSQDETDDGVATDEKHPLLVFREKIRQEEVQFYCGGSIPVTDGPDHPKGLMADEGSRSSPPVVLRFDDPNGGAIRKLCLPLSGGDQDASAIGGLLRSSAPATFGQGGKAVLDESSPPTSILMPLGSSTQLPRSSFQAFVWPSSVELGMSEERLGVVAELYNLNIYSGPSGGQLRVAHAGDEKTWDWSVTDGKEISWAAFYSDCEHEVLEVAEGHRITLTYNLYVSERVGGALRNSPTIDPRSYGLSNSAKEILGRPNFLRRGGTLGFFCAHAYPHSDHHLSGDLPYALKGVDVIVFAVFRALGLDVRVRPVMENVEGQEDSEDENLYLQRDIVGAGLHALQFSYRGGIDGDVPPIEVRHAFLDESINTDEMN